MKSKSKNQPSPPARLDSLFSRLDPAQRKVMLVGLIVFFVLAVLTTLLLAYYVFEPQITQYLQSPTATPTPTATPQCVQPTLSLGSNNYPLNVISLTSSGAIPTPAGGGGNAWWVSDTFSPFVFIVKPLTGGPDLQRDLITGEALVVQWADCGREDFVLTDIQAGGPDVQNLLAQGSPGIAIIVQPEGTSPGYVIHGQRPELVNPPTPQATLPYAMAVDITYELTSPSVDQQTLDIKLTITNRGSQALTLTEADLSLTADGQPPLSPLSVQPALPQAILPGVSLPVTITFTNPGGHTAVLKVFDVTADLYY